MRFIVGESFSYHPKIMIRQSWPLTLKGAPRSGEKKGKGQKIFWAARPLEEAEKKDASDKRLRP